VFLLNIILKYHNNIAGTFQDLYIVKNMWKAKYQCQYKQ